MIIEYGWELAREQIIEEISSSLLSFPGKIDYKVSPKMTEYVNPQT
jgi:hypothetical protein